MKNIITNGDKNLLIANIMKINDTLNINKITNKIKYSNKKKNELKIEIENFIDFCNENNKELLPIIDKLFINLKLVCSSPKANSNNILKDIELIDNNVDINDAFHAVFDESINEEQFNEFINLIKNKIKFNLAFVIAKNFNSAEIIKFMTIIDFGVDTDIAYDVVDIFEDNQISEFLKLVSDGYNNESAYDIVLLYNNNQRILCKEFIKNNLSYNLIESYTEEQITKFLKLINEDNIDFNNAKNIIDNEPPAKRLR